MKKRIEPGPGQESVWDYPRPPALEPTQARISIMFDGQTLADSTEALRILETSHPPVYYIPPNDIEMGLLEKVAVTTYCEWKGQAHYLDIISDDKTSEKSCVDLSESQNGIPGP